MNISSVTSPNTNEPFKPIKDLFSGDPCAGGRSGFEGCDGALPGFLPPLRGGASPEGAGSPPLPAFVYADVPESHPKMHSQSQSNSQSHASAHSHSHSHSHSFTQSNPQPAHPPHANPKTHNNGFPFPLHSHAGIYKESSPPFPSFGGAYAYSPQSPTYEPKAQPPPPPQAHSSSQSQSRSQAFPFPAHSHSSQAQSFPQSNSSYSFTSQSSSTHSITHTTSNSTSVYSEGPDTHVHTHTHTQTHNFNPNAPPTPSPQNPAKKRKREEEEEAIDYAVSLSREELLKMSSEDFEDYVKNLKDHKNLSSDELGEIKRQRRLIKNRESAQTSRNKKRQYITTLKTQLQHLCDENSGLKLKIKNLETKIKQLEDGQLANRPKN